MAELVTTGPADAREEAYRLLAQRAPTQVLKDEAMPVGAWVIVRGPTVSELHQRAVAEAHPGRAAAQGAEL